MDNELLIPEELFLVTVHEEAGRTALVRSRKFDVLLAAAILMELASDPKWRNPPPGTPDHEKGRRRFLRLRNTLDELIGIPGDAFETDDDVWKPNFTVLMHKSLSGIKASIAVDKDPDDLPDWHPMSRANSTID